MTKRGELEKRSFKKLTGKTVFGLVAKKGPVSKETPVLTKETQAWLADVATWPDLNEPCHVFRSRADMIGYMLLSKEGLIFQHVAKNGSVGEGPQVWLADGREWA